MRRAPARHRRPRIVAQEPIAQAARRRAQRTVMDDEERRLLNAQDRLGELASRLVVGGRGDAWLQGARHGEPIDDDRLN